MKNIWKYLVGLAVILLFAGYILFGRQNSDPIADTTGGTGETTTTTPTPSTTPNPTPTGQYKDGSYTGSTADAFYGTIQVKAIISGGQLTDVQFLQFPNAPGHTTDVSNEALPQLKQEAIVAQSANVNIVSGATQDSQAFQQSLAVALAQAKN